MGFFQMIADAIGMNKQEARILVIGLDNSGKTTVVHHLKPKKVTPTVGFTVEEFSKNNINFTIFDMSGQGRYRSLWEHYYKDVQAIIFVLDSTDRFRIVVAKEELDQLLTHEDIRQSPIPIIFFANKMDISGAMTPEECMDELQLDRIRDKPWHITSSNGITGEGISEGIEWLCEKIATNGRRK